MCVILDLRDLNKHFRKYKLRMLTHASLLYSPTFRRIVHVNRPQGLLFSHPNIPSTQEIPQICLPWDVL